MQTIHCYAVTKGQTLLPIVARSRTSAWDIIVGDRLRHNPSVRRKRIDKHKADGVRVIRAKLMGVV